MSGKFWDEAFNPILGCSPASDGCENCYASRFASRFSGPGQPWEGLAWTKPASDFGQNGRWVREPRWTGEVRFVPERLSGPLKRRKPTTYFNSMCDLFHEKVTNEQIAACFGVMAACQQHTFIISTKRWKRCAEWFAWLDDVAEQVRHVFPADTHAWRRSHCLRAPLSRACPDAPIPASTCAFPWPLANVTLLFSASTQAALQRAAPILLGVPAGVRGIIAEPMIEPLNLHGVLCSYYNPERLEQWYGYCCGRRNGRLWVIVGAETGPCARPCKPEWIRRVVDDCQAAGVPCWVKEAGDAELEKARERP